MTDQLQADEVAELERMLHTGDGKHNWAAADRLSDFIESDPETVWRLVAKWGCVRNDDTRTAIACCVLEDMLSYRFEEFFPQVKRLALENARFADTFKSCWCLGDLETRDPASFRQWRALLRRIEGRRSTGP